ncbi:MFS general substrate transporter [Lepidopterella palustris CBS 459.81]|uniref:MFS general substrate transporter n=1 Tax=Lepidopterella palustris CBS 459.81 TaxID=1314670 RepID=A0A8E2DZN1_9PEZI|nr:MFS general substrate transporter [Lepidopterella palustris CBS 459.81]
MPRGKAAVTTLEAPRSPKKPFSFYMSFLSLQLLALITSWDATLLAVALPAITHQPQGTTLESFWASISFILGVAVTEPIYVSVSDVLGRKLPLYSSMVLFAIGAIVFATAQNMSVVIAGRLIQGLEAGGLDVLEEIILADPTSLKERLQYIGLLAISIATGSITGPVLGALFSEFVDWR